jgi:DNA-binding NarL/FixJ family response regulator
VTRTRVLVADAQSVFRAAVRTILASDGGFDVFEAASLPDIERVLDHGAVEIALLDLELPPAGALDAVRTLRERCRAEVIVWSFRPDQETVFEAIRAGASGYLHKEISPNGLLRSLRGAARGEAPLSRELMGMMIGALHSLEARHRAREQAGVLSARERQVLARVARGSRNRQIADELAISEFTVKRHVQNILQKLGVSSRRDAAAFYRSAYAGAEETVGV